MGLGSLEKPLLTSQWRNFLLKLFMCGYHLLVLDDSRGRKFSSYII